jgi:5-methylcytosine-specific restriction protein A
MARREFPQKVKVAVVKRATKDGVTYCEKCGAIAKRWQIDHVIADAIGGEPVIENAELICEPCFSVKNPQDTKLAAKVKRVEARALGIRKPPTLKSPGFTPAPPQRKASTPMQKTCAGMPAILRRFGQ